MSQVFDGKVKKMPRARLLLGCMLCVESICPLSGVPCPPFIDQGGAWITDGRNRKKPKVEKVLRRSWVFLSPYACLDDMADRVRDGMFVDPHSVVPWPLSASGCVPSYTSGWCGMPESRAVTLWGVDGEVTICLSL